MEPDVLGDAFKRVARKAYASGRSVMLVSEQTSGFLPRLSYSYPYVTLRVPHWRMPEMEAALDAEGARRRVGGQDTTPTPGKGIKVR